MKKSIYVTLTLFFVLFSCKAQFNAQSKKITEKFFPENQNIENVTPALKKLKGYTNYEELISFLKELETKHSDLVNLTFIGESQKGMKIPLLKISNSNLKEKKIKVWIQGGLHGNELASSEGVLYLLHEILNKPENHYLFDKIDLAVVPMANIDGYLKRSRNASNGLDLNRDQTKLMAPETVVLKKAFSDFNAEVALDFHEYNPFRKDFTKLSSFGVTSYYDVMFLYSGNLNVPKNIRLVTDSLFVQNARNVLDLNKLSYFDYISTDDFNGEIHFTQGSLSARSSATSFALTNTISTLIEVRGVGLDRTSFKRRINTAFLIAMSYLKTTYDNFEIVKKILSKAQEKPNEVIVLSEREISKDSIKVIDLDTNDLIEIEVTIRNALKSKPKLVRNLPEAYIISQNQTELIAKLDILGIQFQKLTEEKMFKVESYLVTSFNDNAVAYEKMNMQNVTTKIVVKEVIFPTGTYYISTKQKNTPLLIELIEPEAVNSFVSFGVLKTRLNEELPIYRLTKINP